MVVKFGEQDDVNDCEDVPVTQLPSYRAMVAWCAQLPEIKELLISERTQGMEDAFSDLTEDDSEGQYTDGPDWKKKLTINAKTGQLEPTLNNAILLPSHMVRNTSLSGSFTPAGFAAIMHIYIPPIVVIVVSHDGRFLSRFGLSPTSSHQVGQIRFLWRQ